MTFAVNIAQGGANNVSFRNRIINGAMVIDQRNAGAAKTLTAGTVAYVLDRFYAQTDGGAGVVQQVAGTDEFTKAMRITGASGVTGGYFGQKIESYNIADCASSTVTYKLRASSSVLTTLTWYARFPTAQDNYAGVTLITSGSITITSTPTNYTFQIALPSGVTNGLEVYFTFGAFTSGTLDITGVQLEKGSTATSFDYRPFGTELMLCQRYYWQISENDGNSIFWSGAVNSALSGRMVFPFNMRSTPTVTFDAALYINDATANALVNAATARTAVSGGGVSVLFSSASSVLTLGRAASLYGTGSTTPSFVGLSSEL